LEHAAGDVRLISVGKSIMTKSLFAAAALTIGLAGSAVAQERVHRHHHHHRHQMLQPGPSPDALSPPGPSPDSSDRSSYWSPAGGNPIHYAQTSGFYAGR
jgi:hypothetical protein